MSKENGRLEERKLLTSLGVDVESEVKRIYQDFLIPTSQLLADLAKDSQLDHVGISVRTRTASFITTPPTTVGALPKSPSEDASLFWSVVADDAPKYGFQGDFFPKKTATYIFNFIMKLKD